LHQLVSWELMANVTFDSICTFECDQNLMIGCVIHILAFNH